MSCMDLWFVEIWRHLHYQNPCAFRGHCLCSCLQGIFCLLFPSHLIYILNYRLNLINHFCFYFWFYILPIFLTLNLIFPFAFLTSNTLSNNQSFILPLSTFRSEIRSAYCRRRKSIPMDSVFRILDSESVVISSNGR